jgi:hypothetical protein
MSADKKRIRAAHMRRASSGYYAFVRRGPSARTLENEKLLAEIKEIHVERFFGTLKQELVHRCDFETRAEAKSAIFEYIEVFYNRWRRYSYLGYMSPDEFEAAAVTAALAA